ncbi:MAG: hypothetical protein Q7R98_00525 [Candidatus Jorgensenbacteria bacterium]|nr:hypothetical protein [Candidatus Jorgensenbacteria bacterium]
MFESRSLTLFVALAAVLAIFFTLLQYSRSLAVLDVNPNFLLIFLIVLPFLRFGFFRFSAASALVLLFAVLFFPFWFWEMVALITVTLLAGFARQFLTGNRILDFFILILGTTLILNSVLPVLSGFEPLWFRIALEALYNVLLGCVAVPLITRQIS